MNEKEAREIAVRIMRTWDPQDGPWAYPSLIGIITDALIETDAKAIEKAKVLEEALKLIISLDALPDPTQEVEVAKKALAKWEEEK